MSKYEGLNKACRDSIEWVKRNLNPHQHLVITLNGVKIVSDDYCGHHHSLIGKNIFITDAGGRYSTYHTFYEAMKIEHPNLPPYAENKPIIHKVLKVVDVRPHLVRKDEYILVLVNEDYTYLLVDDCRYYKEVL